MSELGYHAQIEGGIHGTPDPGDPATRAALQEQFTQMAIARASEPGSVPPSYRGYPGVGPSNEQVGGPSNLPIIGWTAQKDTGPAFVEPYTAVDMGHIPDWTADVNPIGAGAYDQTQVVAYGDYNPLGVAPLGDGLLQFDDTPTNPNAPTTDVGGTIDLEY